jgi:hypothetical protein
MALSRAITARIGYNELLPHTLLAAHPPRFKAKRIRFDPKYLTPMYCKEHRMILFSREELRTLVDERAYPCVSILQPTHRAGADIQQDPIRFKNLLRSVEETLLAGEMRRPDVMDLLEPAQRLLDDRKFWEHSREGLAVYLSGAPDSFRYYRVPMTLPEIALVSDHFHTKPLLPLLTGDGQFYVLALAQNSVRLLEGTRFTVSEVDLENAPKSLAEVLRFDDFERQLQSHTKTTQGGEQMTVFHGHGAGEEVEKEQVLRYFHKIDDGLRSILAESHAPLVLAGTDNLFSIYREANSYNHLVEGGVAGNPEMLSAEELHTAAWAIVEPLFRQAQDEARERYAMLSGNESASDRLADIVPAAFYGRVATLFVPLSEELWGTFDAQNNRLEVHAEARPDNADLYDLAATQTILNGGTVYAVEPDDVPGHAPVAAVFRY